MSRYTIELRTLCDLYGRDTIEGYFKKYKIEDYLSERQIQTLNDNNVWSKDKLAKKIVDHYFFREIGAETPNLFEHYAEVLMNEIMEKYLPIIYTNAVDYDPFESVDFHITEERHIDTDNTGNTEGASHSTSNSTSTNISNNSDYQVNSDTPQTNINKNDILTGKYATSANAGNQDNTSNTDTDISDNTTNTTSSTSKGKSIETFTHDEKGNKGVLDSYQKMILQLRDTFRAVDTEIINELSVLFIGLYN